MLVLEGAAQVKRPHGNVGEAPKLLVRVARAVGGNEYAMDLRVQVFDNLTVNLHRRPEELGGVGEEDADLPMGAAAPHVRCRTLWQRTVHPSASTTRATGGLDAVDVHGQEVIAV